MNNVVVSAYTVYYHVVLIKFHVIFFTVYFGRGYFNTQGIPLVTTALCSCSWV